MAELTQTIQQSYKRFSPSQRLEHMILLLSFTGLGLTGLPQRYADQEWAQIMIAMMGGIESIRIVHRILATILMAESIYHGGVLTYKLLVLGHRATMIPGFKDVGDVLSWIAFNLGIKKEHPKLPRYNFGEKVEYLAVVWGTVVMIITGFMMWNPIATAKFLPGEVIPAAKAAHSAEALLAILAIIVWHMYNVHIRRFNRAMFTGKLEHEAMEEEHGAELEDILAGKTQQENSPEIIAQRRKIFIPYAVVMSILLTTGLIFFISFENTAITTLPERDTTIDTDISVASANAENGAILWVEKECSTCHGDNGTGNNLPLGVSIIDRELTIDAVARAVRVGPAEMPAFPTNRLTNAEIADLWAFLQSHQQ